MTTSCNDIQERVAVGEALDESTQAHVLACPACSRVAAAFLALDAQVAEELWAAVHVPEGFADRVMVRLDQAAPSGTVGMPAGMLNRLLARRWVQMGLAYLGATVALVNVLRFVLASLIPGASLGGMR